MSSNLVEQMLNEAKSVELGGLMDELQQAYENGEITIFPTDKIDARKWILAYEALVADNEFLSEEYIPHIQELYVAPIKEKIAKNEGKMEYIKKAFLQFLRDNDDRNISFPDIGTVSKILPAKEPIYPEDCDALAERLAENGDKGFVKEKMTLNKARIREYVKENGQSPIEEIGVSEGEEGIRVTLKKKDNK